LAIDAADDLYVADSGNSTIRKISHDGVVSTVAGLANYPGFVDGLGASARFLNPPGVGADAAGKIFVGDSYTIRQIAADGFVTTLAGAPGNPGGSDGTGPAASFWLPYGVAPDASGNVYVADYGYSSIRKVTPEGVVTTIAGLSLSGGSADGTGTAARFLGPSGLVVLASGDIYVADQGNHTIRKIAPGGVVTTFAGTAGVQGSADGAGTAASFYRPFAVAVDSQGNLFVTDHYNKKIRKITPEGVVSTFAGSGVHDSSDGTGTAASFRYPAGIAIDGADNVYVTDVHAIRKITPAGVVTTFAGQAVVCGANN
jgi:streptogramin lyase